MVAIGSERKQCAVIGFVIAIHWQGSRVLMVIYIFLKRCWLFVSVRFRSVADGQKRRLSGLVKNTPKKSKSKIEYNHEIKHEWNK